MTRFSRRRFLKLTLAVGGAALAAAVALRFSYETLRERVVYRLPGDRPPGEPDPHVLSTLMAVTVTLLGSEIERGHYESYFRWYASNVTGYLGLYERAVRLLDRRSTARYGRSFVDSDEAQQRSVIKGLRTFGAGSMRKLWIAFMDRDRLLFERYVVQPVFELFASTDALIRIGYTNWPGIPAGIDDDTASATLLARRPNA